MNKRNPTVPLLKALIIRDRQIRSRNRLCRKMYDVLDEIRNHEGDPLGDGHLVARMESVMIDAMDTIKGINKV